jgi:hypothetical protein
MKEQMSMHKNWFIILSLFIFPSADVYSQNDKLSVDKDHILGVMEAHLTSLEGWRSGNALIRLRSNGTGRVYNRESGEFIEGPKAKSVTRSSTIVQRIVFDFDKPRALVLNRTEFEQQVFDSLDKEFGKAD